MPAILYIAGYGRSGSTVFGAVLGNHAEVVSVGELAFGPEDWWDAQRSCSCGESYARCGFWRGLLEVPGLRGRSGTARRWERLSRVPRLLVGRIPPAERAEYRAVQHAILGHVEQQSGRRVVLDSSKSARLTAGRALALHRLAGFEVFVLHLVRDGRSTMDSLVTTGRNWAIEGHAAEPRFPALRAALGWAWTNAYTCLLRYGVARNRYLRVRYEDFLARPAAVLQAVGAFAGLDAAATQALALRVASGDSFAVGHVCGGNRVRFQPRVALRAPARPAKAVPLSWRSGLLFTLIGGWLNRRFGYATDPPG